MLFALVSAAAAEPVSTVPESVERYARDMDAAMKSSGPVSLETVFDEGFSAAKGLTLILERFDEPTYQKVQRLMIGFFVTRAEVIVAAPNAGFLLKLAREKGTLVDQAFFGVLKETYPDGYWPAYNDRQTDYSGCTIFDGKTLTGIYGAWITFQSSYPGRYREATQKELANVEEELLNGTCACGGEDGVRKELESFLKVFSSSPLAAKVASRLEAVNSHTSEFRFHCEPR
jgi:hypothetical protein